MAEPNGETDYGLVMPFVVCKDDEPFEAAGFVNGWLCGDLDAKLQAMGGMHCVVEFTADPRVLPQLDLIAMKHGLTMTSEPWDEHPDEWAFVKIGPGAVTEGQEDQR